MGRPAFSRAVQRPVDDSYDFDNMSYIGANVTVTDGASDGMIANTQTDVETIGKVLSAGVQPLGPVANPGEIGIRLNFYDAEGIGSNVVYQVVGNLNGWDPWFGTAIPTADPGDVQLLASNNTGSSVDLRFNIGYEEI